MSTIEVTIRDRRVVEREALLASRSIRVRIWLCEVRLDASNIVTATPAPMNRPNPSPLFARLAIDQSARG
jgi:hypothetical protein